MTGRVIKVISKFTVYFNMERLRHQTTMSTYTYSLCGRHSKGREFWTVRLHAGEKGGEECLQECLIHLRVSWAPGIPSLSDAWAIIIC